MSAFSIALSGLTAASTDLDVVSNNVANADTVGFKEARTEFADVYSAGAVNLNAQAVGEGTRVDSTAQQFTQGDITTTSSNLDLAISGDGFFTLQDASGTVYSRNGAFSEDKNGNVVNATGQALQVYPPVTAAAGAATTFNTGTTTDLNLQTAQSAPNPTTTATVILNLPSNSTPVPATVPFSATNPASYTESTSTTVYDSLGTASPATLYFVQTTTPNVWTVHLTVNGTPVGAAAGQTLDFSTAGAVTPAGSGTLAFNGYQPTDGAAAMNMSFNFNQATQYGGSFGVSSIVQNGYSTGQLSTVSLDPTGIVSAVYTNGRTTQLGQLALANFPDPQGLKQLGDTNWAQTYTSGTVVQGTAGSAGFGSIQSGALESSNVDLTTQLVDMITAQRAFEANAQSITTANQLSETVINITH
jgi:flagellar hook protein FlgE